MTKRSERVDHLLSSRRRRELRRLRMQFLALIAERDHQQLQPLIERMRRKLPWPLNSPLWDLVQ